MRRGLKFSEEIKGDPNLAVGSNYNGRDTAQSYVQNTDGEKNTSEMLKPMHA